MSEDRRVLIVCIAGSFLIYHTVRKIWSYTQTYNDQWIPVGKITSLCVYPIKSCAPQDVFTFKCTAFGPVFGNSEDRSFMLMDGVTGKFYTGRQHPKLVKVVCEIVDEIVRIRFPNQVEFSLKEVVEHGKIFRATMFKELKQDGFDCGDTIAKAFAEHLGEPNVRLIYHRPGMYTERTSVPKSNWWNNPVPQSKYDSRFNDLAPFMITTQSSLIALNERLENKVTTSRFRPSILIDGPVAWDEDKWAELKIGNVRLECFAPCTRCVMTLIDPDLGIANRDLQPLKTLREFRLVPEGKMRDYHKESPVFGVYLGLKGSFEGYIHVGQTVYARYKDSAF